MFDLKEIFKTLGLPLALVAVIVAVLAWVGVDVERLQAIAAALVGLQLCVSFLVDVLKYAGVIEPGQSGKWSAAINLVVMVGIAVYLKWFPAFDIMAMDAQIMQVVKLLIPVFAYVTQIIGTKAVHKVADKYGLTFSFYSFG